MHQQAQTEPQTALCAGCGRSASTILTARGSPTYPVRAVATCSRCLPQHERWVRTAGAVQRRELGAPADVLF